ncbi:hypothetical protein NQ317_004931 [Molorchus minor]|uniref:Uncharacterized protein n=1 Tax=Molorchus minor TaxID=1323400 RepID=A0ABQ9JTY4_9CUCU|nr:hypothetical protein NQ317_004931 [Molorchus minor]
MEAISLETAREHLSTKLEKLQGINKTLEGKLQVANNENNKLHKESQNNTVQMETVMTEINHLKEKMNKKRRAIKDLEDVIKKHERKLEEMERKIKKQQEIITDRECEIEIANEDAKGIRALEDQIKELEKRDMQKIIDNLTRESFEKDAKVEELNKERSRLQELLNEKDKIINQISEDSHKLHVNLVTIQSKLKETGNIIDLGNRLKEEQKRTAELVEEIQELKAQLMHHEMAKKTTDMTTSVDEITSQVRKELDYSAQIDSNIINAVSDQSLSSFSENQDIDVYKKALSKEKAAKKQLVQVHEQLKRQINDLEERCSSLQSFNGELQQSLEKERLLLHQTQVEDAKLIEHMRIQLDTAVDNEEALGKMLDEEKAARKRLESEIEELKRRTISYSGASKTESTEYKSPPSKEMVELKHLRRELESVQEEKLSLVNEIKQLKIAKNEIEKEMLSVETQKGNSLEDKVQGLIQSERELRDSLLQKKVELDEKLRVIENNKIAMDELEREKAHLNKQKQELIQRLKLQTPNDTQNDPSATVPDILLNKIKELNNALLDNKKLIDIIQRISTDKKQLENELAEIKGRRATSDLPFNDLIARSDYLFAKTLKLESIKKALIWQKRYLLDYLQGHQRHCLIEALPHTMPYRNDSQMEKTPKEKFRTVATSVERSIFRCCDVHTRAAVIVVISILRMKFLVRRWHSGVRIAEKNQLTHLQTKTEKSVPTQFQLGEPISSQLFSSCIGRHYSAMEPRNVVNWNQEYSQENAYGGFIDDGRESSGSARDNSPWSGNTPPSKEGSTKSRIRIGSTLYRGDSCSIGFVKDYITPNI